MDYIERIFSTRTFKKVINDLLNCNTFVGLICLRSLFCFREHTWNYLVTRNSGTSYFGVLVTVEAIHIEFIYIFLTLLFMYFKID